MEDIDVDLVAWDLVVVVFVVDEFVLEIVVEFVLELVAVKIVELVVCFDLR